MIQPMQGVQCASTDHLQRRLPFTIRVHSHLNFKCLIVSLHKFSRKTYEPVGVSVLQYHQPRPDYRKCLLGNQEIQFFYSAACMLRVQSSNNARKKVPSSPHIIILLSNSEQKTARKCNLWAELATAEVHRSRPARR